MATVGGASVAWRGSGCGLGCALAYAGTNAAVMVQDGHFHFNLITISGTLYRSVSLA